jgi:hypothetical protein
MTMKRSLALVWVLLSAATASAEGLTFDATAIPVFSSPAAQAIGKLALSGATVYACDRLRKRGKKREARILAITVGVIGAGMALHNSRQTR